MSKVLYLSHFYDHSSWATAAEDYIKAIEKHGEVVCRPVIIHGNKQPTDYIKSKEGSLDGVTHVIQHVIPEHIEYNGDFHCVGIGILETDSCHITGWDQKFDMLDMWTPTKYHANKFNWKYVPHTTDVSKYEKDYGNVLKYLNDQYVFYTIAEFNTRKRLTATIRAYHLAFNNDDQATLIVKTNKLGQSAQQTLNLCQKVNEQIKAELHAYGKYNRFKDPIFITERVDENTIMSLHQNADCFLLSSYGEAFCMPCFDALGFGNYVIANKVPGVEDYLSTANASLINNTLSPCFGAEQYIQDIHSSRENWWDMDVLEMSEQMRFVYESKLQKTDLNKNIVKQYDYDNIGKLIWNYLDS